MWTCVVDLFFMQNISLNIFNKKRVFVYLGVGYWQSKCYILQNRWKFVKMCDVSDFIYFYIRVSQCRLMWYTWWRLMWYTTIICEFVYTTLPAIYFIWPFMYWWNWNKKRNLLKEFIELYIFSTSALIQLTRSCFR